MDKWGQILRDTIRENIRKDIGGVIIKEKMKYNHLRWLEYEHVH